MLAVSVCSFGAAGCAPASVPALSRILIAGSSHALLTRSIAASHTRRRLCTASAAFSSTALRPVAAFSTPQFSSIQRLSAEPLPFLRQRPSSQLAAAPAIRCFSSSSCLVSAWSRGSLPSAASPLSSVCGTGLSRSPLPASSPALTALILVRCFSSAPSVAPKKRASSGSPDSTFSSASAFTSSSQLNTPPSIRPPVTASSVPAAPAASVPKSQTSSPPPSTPAPAAPSTAAAGSPSPATSPSPSASAAAVSGSAVSTSPAASTPPPASSLLAAEASPTPGRAQRVWQRVKAEVRHYVNGTKLLYAEIKIAYGLTLQVLRGHELSRRERRQLTRTSADILRLVPFLVIVIVPFMEFALPVLLKLFPNMLPSTYLDHKGEEAKLKKQLAAKIEMARFLQDTTALMAGQLLEKQQAAAAAGAAGEASEERRVTVSSFQSLMQKVRRGESVRNSEILSISRLFDEDFTLEHLNHGQLAAMCRLLDLRVFGSDWVLRYKLNKKLDELRDDDKQIKKEGVDSLTLPELQEACRARGIHSAQSPDYMRRKLRDWLELSLEHDVPISLLVLSRAFSVSLAGVRDADVELSEGLAATLKHIPDVVVEDTAQTIVDRSDDVQEKLELIRKEEEEARKSKEEARQQQQLLPAAASEQQQQKEVVRTHTVVGLADIKEKLEDIREDNDELEEDIDQAIAAKEPQSGDAAAAAIRLPADSTADGKEVSTEVDRERAALSSAAARAEAEKLRAEPRVEKKKVARVDRLNDTVEELVARVQEELQQHEQQTKTADAAKQQQEAAQQQQKAA